jgi:hypothetical protein
MTQTAITFFKKGDAFFQGVDTPSQRYEKLPGGIYLVSVSMETGFFVKELPNFDLPKRLYGDIKKQAIRILDTFADRPATTGVLLSGEKGSGKTLLTKTICSTAAKLGIPTLVVNNSFGGDSFNTFLQSITQPCILLFDEFEKVYDADSQQGLLTLFDGIFTTQKLILLTSNDYGKINSHLQNRPGRIYYNLEFNGLDNDFIMEYGKDNLKNPVHVNGLGVVASMVKPMSFDILQAIVEECNRYDESPVKTMEILNVKEYASFPDTYLVSIVSKKGKKISLKAGEPDEDGDFEDNSEVRCNPFKAFRCDYYLHVPATTKAGKPKKAAAQYIGNILKPEQLTSFDGIHGIYKFETEDLLVTLTRKPLDSQTKFEKYEHLAVTEDRKDL